MCKSPKLCVRVGPVIVVLHEDAPAQAGAGEEGVGRVTRGGDPEALCTLGCTWRRDDSVWAGWILKTGWK